MGETVRTRLRALYPASSGRRLKTWLEGGRVRLNGATVRRGDVAVGPGDRVELGAAPPPALPPPLALVHEDPALLVVVKPPGLLSVADAGERERTVYRMLRDWLDARAAGRVFVVHRLDRETSGLLVFARTPAAKAALQAQFRARTVERRYVARVEGRVREGEGTLTSRLAEDPLSLRVRPVGPGGRGRPAITRFRVLARAPDETLLELALVTGRRGQIRAQLAARGHPVVGDRAFGSRRDPLRRLALHATRLAFVHPDGGRVAFESPLPPGFAPGRRGRA